MQCLSCTFENLPGTQLCARCGSRLDLGSVAIEPPRAAHHNAATALSRAGYRLRSRCPNFHKLWNDLHTLNPEPLEFRALAWSIIPGVGHLKIGQRSWGWWLLSIWLGFFVLLLVSLGTVWSPFMVMGMIAVHVLTVAKLFADTLAFEHLLMRVLFGLGVFLALNFFVYDPCIWLCSRFLVILPVAHSPASSVIQNGDGLLCQGPWIRPDFYALGDIVMYRLDELRSRAAIIRAGYGVNRVVGLPGDHVTRKHGLLMINGKQPEERFAPLGHVPAIVDFDITLGVREYAIFTTVQYIVRGGQPTHRLSSISATWHLNVVSYDNILGRVLLRIRPLSRFGHIGNP